MSRHAPIQDREQVGVRVGELVKNSVTGLDPLHDFGNSKVETFGEEMIGAMKLDGPAPTP
jgi:hypothetical protein